MSKAATLVKMRAGESCGASGLKLSLDSGCNTIIHKYDQVLSFDFVCTKNMQSCTLFNNVPPKRKVKVTKPSKYLFVVL